VAETESFACTQCGSQMVRKTGGWFSALLRWGGLIAVLVGGILIWAGFDADRRRTEAAEKAAYETALEALEAVEINPRPFVEEFRTQMRVTEETLQDLPDLQRGQVRRILETFRAKRRWDTPTGCAPIAGLFDAFVVGAGGILLIAGLLGVAVGLLLTRRRAVWCCDSCGARADRA
jgi:hypothetical protein